jgi:hypothetical protein
MRVSSITPAGTLPRRSSSMAMEPLARYSATFLAVELPMPLSSAICSGLSVDRSSGVAAIALAARS